MTPRRRPAARLLAAFPALRSRDFRYFIGGQLVSYSGTWMQSMAHGWLVLQLSNSPLVVGIVGALAALPILLFTLYGGIVADRVRKRPFVILMQSLLAVEALALGVLVVTKAVTVPWVMGFALFLGLVTAFEVPARQAFVAEVVGKEAMLNAIALQSSAYNLARVLGPVMAGLVISWGGVGAAFFANAASFLAVIWGLTRMTTDPPAAKERRDVLAQFREGAGYVLQTRWPRALLVMTATTTIFGFSFLAMLPVLARDVLGTGASGYGGLLSAVGLGALGGALFMATFGARAGQGRFALGAGFGFGAALVAVSQMPTYPLALAALAATGVLMVLHNIAVNSMLQSQAPDALRGRVMGFYSFVVLGMAPFGNFQVGWVAEHFGVRRAFLAGGLVVITVAALLALALRRAQGPGRPVPAPVHAAERAGAAAPAEAEEVGA